MFLKLPSNPGSQESCSTEAFCSFPRKSTFSKLVTVLHTEFSVLGTWADVNPAKGRKNLETGMSGAGKSGKKS